MTTTPLIEGLHQNIPAPVYHSDPCVTPSFSASIGSLLLDKSPLHAWFNHPRLNINRPPEDEPSSVAEIGRAAHALLLKDGPTKVFVVDAKDWRTEAAKSARAAHRSKSPGCVVLLPHQYAAACELVQHARLQLAQHEVGNVFDRPGIAEATLVWRDGGVLCRSRLDWMVEEHPVNPPVIYDVKTTGGSADPDAWVRRLYEGHGDLQAGLYIRAVRRLTDRMPIFRYVVIEQSAPYALSVIELSEAALHMSDRKVSAALRMWESCLAVDRWPGYPTAICAIDPPPWELSRWMEREMIEDAHPRNPAALFNAAAQFQAPVKP